MFDYDGDGGFAGMLVGIALVLAVVAFVIYCIILLAAALAGLAAAGGTLYGGGAAVKNYILSFKENIIDSNRRVLATA